MSIGDLAYSSSSGSLIYKTGTGELCYKGALSGMILSANLYIQKRTTGLSTWHDGDKYNWMYTDDTLQATSSQITSATSSWQGLGVTASVYHDGENSVPPYPVEQDRLFVEASFRRINGTTAELRFYLGSTGGDGNYRYYGELDTFSYGVGTHSISYTYLAAVVSGTFTVTLV